MQIFEILKQLARLNEEDVLFSLSVTQQVQERGLTFYTTTLSLTLINNTLNDIYLYLNVLHV